LSTATENTALFSKSHGNLVYLLEEDSKNADHIMLALLDWGYEVYTFENMQEIMQTVVKRRPDVLLLNTHASVISRVGMGLLRNVQNQQKNPIPIVFTSKFNDQKSLSAAIKANGDAFFCYPLHYDVIARKLRQLTLIEQQENYRVLIIDDSQQYADKYANALNKKGISTEILTTPVGIIKALNSQQPHLVMINTKLNHPGLSALELAMVVRQQNKFKHTPIVFFAQAFDQTLQRSVMQSISDDYLHENIDTDSLVDTVIKRIKNSQKQWRKPSNDPSHDRQTGLYNRQYLLAQLELLKHYDQVAHSLAVLFISLDNYHGIHQIMGLTASEQVLLSCAKQLQIFTETDDILARVNESLFIIISQNRTLEAVKMLAEKIRHNFASEAVNFGNSEIEISSSIGIGIYQANSGQPLQALRDAKTACISALKQGGNTVVVYGGEQMQNQLQQQHNHWQILLDNALQHEGFMLYYQPVVPLRGEPTAYYDVLLRLKVDGAKPVAAVEFIAIAAQLKLSLDLDRWVIQHSIAQLQSQADNDPPWRFFLRLSEQSLLDETFNDWLQTTLTNAALDKTRLIFELPQHYLEQHKSAAQTLLRQLKTWGYRRLVSGVSQVSELALLNQIKIEFIKLQPKIIQQLNEPNQLFNLKQLQQCCDQCTFIAPMVETSEQFNILWQNHISLISGYFVQKPTAHKLHHPGHLANQSH
jgi:diguanylate cyclase (GGDEF)-like protein